MFNSRKIKELERRIWELENPPLATGTKIFLSGKIWIIVKSQTKVTKFLGVAILDREYIILSDSKSLTYEVKYYGLPEIYNPKKHKVKK